MTVASCGVRPTGVVPGGPAPTVVSTDVTVYLLGADRALVRRTRTLTGEVTAASPLQALLAGVTDAEREEGLTSEVPVTTDQVIAQSGLLVLPLDTTTLSGIAYAQLACTATASGLRIANLKPAFTCP